MTWGWPVWRSLVFVTEIKSVHFYLVSLGIN